MRRVVALLCGPSGEGSAAGSEIDQHVEPVPFHSKGSGRILVDVHQVVRSLSGSVPADDRVGHCFTLDGGPIQAMEVCQLQ